MKQILYFTLLVSSFSVYSQKNHTIEGKVLDASQNNDPILFAKVTIKETNQSMTTGYRGGYFFKDLKAGTYTLVYHFLGYKPVTKKIEIKEENLVVNTALTPSAIQITEPGDLSLK